jgi:S1-C subfamily serine protease
VRRSGKLTLGLLIAAVVFSLPQAGIAEDVQKRIKVEPGDIVIIDGLGAVIEKDGDGPVVRMVPPPEQRAKGYQTVDVAEGDIILMINGKRVATPTDVRIVIDSLEVGDEIKLGVKRGREILIVSLPKAEASTGMVRRIVMTAGDEDSEGEEGGTVREIVTIGGDAVPVIDAALLLTDVDGALEVVALIDNLVENIDGYVPQPGDRITAVQGAEVSSVEDFQAAMAELETGSEVEVTCFDGEEQHTFRFTKTGNEPKVLMKRGH